MLTTQQHCSVYNHKSFLIYTQLRGEAHPESSRKLLEVFLFIPLHARQHLYTFLQVLIPLHNCKSTEIWFIQINTGKNTTCTTYIKKRSDSRIFDQKENGQNVSIFILLYLLWITTNKKTNHHVLGTTNCFSLPSCYSRCGHALCFTEKVFYVTEALTRWRVVHGRKVVVAVLYKCRMLSFVLMHLS